LVVYLAPMAQVTIYLPKEVEKELRAGAKRAKKSLSAYIVDLAMERQHPRKKKGWPKELLDLFGSWEGDFPVPERPPPRDVPDL
jgi:hypothetical protein